ncbi:hypothetical protein OG196_44065 (plasmid) [Kitasatospora purpeofusca]|uniref:hypothetical protein n=1 Tax=Kitasatospora purpeofusca TaxID=67352 RepID=UPI002E0F8709|nr:hypothetical protein OG196_44065 [Kitasatospora purpeofusca]
MNRGQWLAATARAHAEAQTWASLAARTDDPDRARDARLLRETALALADERLSRARTAAR